ncbi:hypothetical protein J7T55_001288 [Diaporthe amygdali]|uniref:uncharacterized protein n=1 Tax=Phomopsis amygdali TaxID=1214568 RepID=UPI0022FE24DD|nr:uncharacterized protein J7T55_001288 [Diaporthe amygdali]KAJ0106764.1 hypothetical protein J7T55_001288 [Diaporthe amygdali]
MEKEKKRSKLVRRGRNKDSPSNTCATVNPPTRRVAVNTGGQWPQTSSDLEPYQANSLSGSVFTNHPAPGSPPVTKPMILTGIPQVSLNEVHNGEQTADSNSTQTATFHVAMRRDNDMEKILSNQARGFEFHDVSMYPASSDLCPFTFDQNVSALIRIDKGLVHQRLLNPEHLLSQPSGIMR